MKKFKIRFAGKSFLFSVDGKNEPIEDNVVFEYAERFDGSLEIEIIFVIGTSKYHFFLDDNFKKIDSVVVEDKFHIYEGIARYNGLCASIQRIWK